MQVKLALSWLSVIAIAYASPLPEPEDIAAAHAISARKAKQCPNYCVNTNTNQSLIHEYVCGDPRLGPKRLPTRLPINDLIDDYDRFGGLCPGQFLATWYNETAKSYIYPPLNGFQLDIAGKPISGTFKFPVGLLLDRFGSEFGSFVSPEGAPYVQRALPPSNLDNPANDPRFPYNYHVYRVVQPFNALSGPIAGWFGQPGQGVQYQLSSNIMTLLNGGFLQRVSLRDL